MIELLLCCPIVPIFYVIKSFYIYIILYFLEEKLLK